MKKIGILKLINIDKERLDGKQMANLRGGSDCNCSCGCHDTCTCSCTGGAGDTLSTMNTTLNGIKDMQGTSNYNLIHSSNTTIPFNYGG